jgi:TolB-like protein/Tfp pilus assembly protein PilF
VLPFVNMSSDPENEYFSDGISEEILNVLASIPELKVAARTSAFAFKGSSATIADIARELGVNHVLEGSVRKAGDQVRITAQLIKADDGFHLWSDTYDRELDNVFAIQDEIAASIAGALKVSLGLGKKSSGNLTGTGSIEAYEHYLRGMSLWHERTVSSLRESIAEFEAATELDPQFAKAQAGLALAWGVITGYIVMDEKEAYRKALAAAKRALALDPENVEALAIQGLIRRYQLAYDEGIALFERAIELNPSFASAYQWYGGLLGEMGDPEAGLAMYEKAWSLDPRSRIIGYNLALRLDGLGRREEAFAVIEEVLAFAPDFPDGLNQRMLMQLESGQCTAAGATARRLATLLEKTIDSTDLYLDLCRGGAARATALQTMLAWPRPLAFADPAHPTLSYDYDWMVLMIELNEMGAVLEVLQEQPETFASELAYLRTRATGNGVRFQCDPRVRELQSRVGLAPPVKPPVCD